MEKLVITGPTHLNGEVTISGAKNAAVAILPATLLIDGVCTIENLPNISDVKMSCKILEGLGAKITWITQNEIMIDTRNIDKTIASEELTRKFRASYYIIGSMLGRKGAVTVGMPGGCKLGARPIDQHIKGFEALGAKVDTTQGKITAKASKLVGTSIYMDVVSVGATINIMMAAVYAKGRTVIENAAREPEIIDIATLLNKMGARIHGMGTSTLVIDGVDYLKGCIHEIIPDRIEAATYVIMAAAMANDMRIENIIPQHLEAIVMKLQEVGINMEVGSDFIHVFKSDKPLKRTEILTKPYPGFATDVQQPFTVL